MGISAKQRPKAAQSEPPETQCPETECSETGSQDTASHDTGALDTGRHDSKRCDANRLNAGGLDVSEHRVSEGVARERSSASALAGEQGPTQPSREPSRSDDSRGVDPCGDRVDQLLDDMAALLDFALEAEGVPLDVDLSAYYRARQQQRQNVPLSGADIDGLVACYRELSRRYPGISPRTLAATRPSRESGRLRDSRTGRYLMRLWQCTAAVVMLAIISNVMMSAIGAEAGMTVGAGAQATLLGFLYEGLRHTEAFLYGALGAFAFVLRVTASRLYSRTFDPARIGEHVNRIVLGTLSGGAIVLFVSQIPSDKGAEVALSGAALGFLAGYSIDFLFGTLDRMIRALLSDGSTDSANRAARARRDADVVETLDELMSQQTDAETRRRLEGIIETLRQRQRV
ncbi:hypothetical protein [Halomonas litopenaei]|uniref:hypothetical protein n=1 Tax=Halomonas litopenaei TaxID=2109328 RepID=UPI001A8CCDAB|nr:hypothetical protein [Halomonas litopenaei]MBN8411478.1 hypothetical protein [Halomonas litopenaei]